MKTQDGEGVWETQVNPDQKCSLLARQDRAQKCLQPAAKHDWHPGASWTNEREKQVLSPGVLAIPSLPLQFALCFQWSINSALLSVQTHVYHGSVLLCILEACVFFSSVEWPTFPLFGKRLGFPPSQMHHGYISRFGTVCELLLQSQKLLNQSYVKQQCWDRRYELVK